MRHIKNCISPVHIGISIVLIFLVLVFMGINCLYATAAIQPMKISGEKTKAGIYRDDIKVEYSVSSEQGVQQVALQLNSKEVGKETFDFTATANGDFTISKETLAKQESKDYSYTLKLIVTDSTGNTEEQEERILADPSIPELEIDGIKDGGLYKENKSVQISLIDNNAENGMLNVKIYKDSTLVLDKEQPGNRAVQFDAEADGVYKVVAKATDKGEHTADIQQTFTIDKTAPELKNVQVSGHRKDTYIWYDDSVTISANCSDESTGLKNISFAVNGAAYKSISCNSEAAKQVEVTLTKDWFKKNESKSGLYLIGISATDAAGNTVKKETDFHADVVSPEVTISGIKDGAFTNTSPTIAIKNNDSYKKEGTLYVEVKRNGLVDKTYEEKVPQLELTAKEDGVYEIYAYAVDLAGNKSKEEFLTFTKDTVAPDITASGEKKISIEGHRNSGYQWYDSAVTIQSTVSDSLSKLSNINVSVNGKTVYEAAPKGAQSKTLQVPLTRDWFLKNESGSGKYTVNITGIDRAGNANTVTSYFYADVITPSISLSGVKPGAYLNTAPKIRAVASDNHEKKGTIVFEIEKNGKAYKTQKHIGKESDFSRFLTDGEYTIRVYAVDLAGNTSKAKTLKFTKDTVAPDITASGKKKISITGHRNSGYQWYDSAVTIQTTVSDPLSKLSDINVSVNGETVHEASPKGGRSKTLQVALSKKWFQKNESGSGKYTINITGIDRAGNANTATSYFYADVTTPSVSSSGVKSGAYLKKTPRIRAVTSDNYEEKGTIVFEIEKNGKAYKTQKHIGRESDYSKFSSDGAYKIKAYAVDLAGNTSKAKTLKFTKDTIAPGLQLSGAQAGSFTNGTRTIAATVKEKNYKNVAVSAQLRKVLDGKTTNESFGAIRPNKSTYAVTRALSATGTYTITLAATDKAGNKAKPQTLTFTVDNDKPVIKIKGLKVANGYSSKVTPLISYEDSYYKNAKISLKRSKGKELEGLTYSDKANRKGGSRTYAAFPRKAKYDDVYTLSCTVVDKAGNTTKERKVFSVNRFGSIYEGNKGTKDVKSSYNKGVEQDIIIRELNVAGLKKMKGEIIHDGERQDVEVDVKTGKKYGWNSYEYVFAKDLFAQEGMYELNVTSTDKNDNFTEYKEKEGSLRFSVDKTAPVITVTGIKENGSYKAAEAKATVSALDAIKLSEYGVTCNGELVYNSSSDDTLPESKEVAIPSGYDQTVLVTALDAAGNQSKMEIKHVTISGNLFVRLWANKALCIGLILAMLLVIGGGAFTIIKRKRREGNLK